MLAIQEPLYTIASAKWMPDVLKAGLIENLTQADWITRAVTLNLLVDVPLDFELTEAAAENLYHRDWPVRLLATYLLAKKQGEKFRRPLLSIAQNDPSDNVKKLASILSK
jgi:hypothetical protein